MDIDRIFRIRPVFLLSCLFLFLTPGIFGQEITRINVKETKMRVASGKALLICAYADYQCERVRLKNAMLKSELEARLPMLSKDTELIFYCA